MNVEYLPSPVAIFRALGEVIQDQLPDDLLHTILATGTALILGMAVGGCVGVVIGMLPRVRAHSMATIDFQRTIPAIALIPIAAMMLGPSTAAEIALAGYAALWPVLISTADAVQSVHPRLLDSARSLRLGKLATVRRVILPSVLPYWLDSARISALAALHVAIATEMIIGQDGLGHAIIRYLNALAPAPMWAYALVCAVLGLAVSEGFRWLATRRRALELARTRPRTPWWALWPIAIVLLGWQLLGSDAAHLLPPPTEWFAALADNGDNVWAAVKLTVLTYALGLAISMVLGVVAGLVFGAAPRIERASFWLLNMLVAIPASVLIPILILLLGYGPASGIAVVVLVATWPIALVCTSARRRVPPVRLEVGRTLHIDARKRLVHIILPSMLPGIALAAKLGSALAFVAALLGDILGGGQGLGRLLIEAHQRFDAASGWGLLLIVGVLGYASSTLIAWFERAVTPPSQPQPSRMRLLQYQRRS